MDPLTAIGLAIAVIKGGIAIYQLIHDHPATTPAMKALVAEKMVEQAAVVTQLEDARSEWEKTHGPETA